ncbi:hypothetical protein QR680_001708 [Steinernema hermaphroditum]|uniref:Uncharacterized protein n=1 Tax=Steinernema hermaphroditum TaxID=289476 RepID=A0AA39LGL2_9BILA|nr:hypothetical protein QR680_001708 [Steinernema hermaphroditum]
MSAKEDVISGGLKLKKGGISKKKKKDKLDVRQIDITIKKDDKIRKTPAELAFEKRQRETAVERLSKKAAVSHREKVEKFNQQMEEMTEFNDIPKVSWTKMQETSPDEEKSPKTENDIAHNSEEEATSSEQVNDVATTSSASSSSPENAATSRGQLEHECSETADRTGANDMVQSTKVAVIAAALNSLDAMSSAEAMEHSDTLVLPSEQQNNGNGEAKENHWSNSSPSNSAEPEERKIKVEECAADTSAHSDSNSLEGPPIVSGSTCNVKEEAQTTTDDMGVDSTNSAMISALVAPSTSDVREAECAQPNGYRSPTTAATPGEQNAVPSCSSAEPTSTVNLVNGERSGAASVEEPSSSTSPKITMPMTRLCLAGDSIHIPSDLCEDEELLRSVLSVETFKSLPEEKQAALKKLLPKYEGSDDDLEKILKCAVTDDEFFCFGNTVSKLFYKLECNWFSPDRPCEELQLRDNRRVMYDHFHRHYYISMLRKLLVSRHRILEKVGELSASEEGEVRLKTNSGFLKRRHMVDRLQDRAKRRCQVMFNNVREQVGESDLSSDDEDDGYLKTKFTPNNNGKQTGKSTLNSTELADIDLHQPLSLGSPINMIEEYIRLREKEPDCMSLDISDIAVDEVYERSGVSIISERNFATMVRKRRQAEEEKCEADSSTDVRTNGHCSNHSGAPNTPRSHSAEDDEEADIGVNNVDHDRNHNSTDDLPDTSSALPLNGIHSDASDEEEDDEDAQFEESLRREEEANNLSAGAHSPTPS